MLPSRWIHLEAIYSCEFKWSNGMYRPELALKPWHTRLLHYHPYMCDSYLTDCQKSRVNSWEIDAVKPTLCHNFMKVRFCKSALFLTFICGAECAEFLNAVRCSGAPWRRKQRRADWAGATRPPDEGGAVVQLTLRRNLLNMLLVNVLHTVYTSHSPQCEHSCGEDNMCSGSVVSLG